MRSPCIVALRSETGLTYLGVIIVASMLSTSLAAAGIVWHVEQQRLREAELLFVGGQFRTAIGRYYLNQAGPQKEYPKRLEDLIRDPRHPGNVRYLRKLYTDPMTGSTDWGLLKTPDGSILGVYSKSNKVPIKRRQFTPADRHLADKSKYSEWKFVYLPGQTLGKSAVGVSAGPPGSSQGVGSTGIATANQPGLDLLGALPQQEGGAWNAVVPHGKP